VSNAASPISTSIGTIPISHAGKYILAVFDGQRVFSNANPGGNSSIGLAPSQVSPTGAESTVINPKINDVCALPDGPWSGGPLSRRHHYAWVGCNLTFGWFGSVVLLRSRGYVRWRSGDITHPMESLGFWKTTGDRDRLPPAILSPET